MYSYFDENVTTECLELIKVPYVITTEGKLDACEEIREYHLRNKSATDRGVVLLQIHCDDGVAYLIKLDDGEKKNSFSP